MPDSLFRPTDHGLGREASITARGTLQEDKARETLVPPRRLLTSRGWRRPVPDSRRRKRHHQAPQVPFRAGVDLVS
jgi:hypothetical protein